MKIAIIGSGYVGLVTGACLSKLGNRVILTDSNEEKLEKIKQKQSPIHEKGLDELLESIELETSRDIAYAVNNSDISFICVNTDSDDPQYPHDLSRIQEVSEKIGAALAGYHLVVVKSTVLPETVDKIVLPQLQKSGKQVGKDFGLCVNPEFLIEGEAVESFLQPDRIIIGEADKRSGDILTELYKGFSCPILRVGLKAAAMIKYASNTFLALKISYINEIGNICKELGVDVYEVAKGIGYDRRIGAEFLKAGVGFGGSCLPKDLRSLIQMAKEMGIEPGILASASRLNENQPLRMLDLLKRHIPDLENKTIGILGLAFKKDTDDIRDSRAARIIPTLLLEGAKVIAYDPVAMENFRKIQPGIRYATPDEVLTSDAVLILTDWPEFEKLDYTRKNLVVIDGRRIAKAREAGIYDGICW